MAGGRRMGAGGVSRQGQNLRGDGQPHVPYPQETIVRGHPNYEYRQKGKQATLACGYGGGVGALKAMGAKMPEEEMQPLVDAWRAANPHIVRFWNALGNAASEVIERQNSVRVGAR